MEYADRRRLGVPRVLNCRVWCVVNWGGFFVRVFRCDGLLWPSTLLRSSCGGAVVNGVVLLCQYAGVHVRKSAVLRIGSL